MPKSATTAWPPDSKTFSGLNVPVDDAVPVGARKRVGDLGRDPERVFERQSTLAHNALAQTLTLNKGHSVVQRAIGLARGQQWENVRVL